MRLWKPDRGMRVDAGAFNAYTSMRSTLPLGKAGPHDERCMGE